MWVSMYEMTNNSIFESVSKLRLCLEKHSKEDLETAFARMCMYLNGLVEDQLNICLKIFPKIMDRLIQANGFENMLISIDVVEEHF